MNGRTIDRLPYDIADAEPIYQDLPGWGALDGDTIPDALERYIRHIEEAVRVPIRLVSTGPDRRQTLERRSPVAAI